MKCPECGGTGCMPIQWTFMLDGICDCCGGTGWVDDDEFDGGIGATAQRMGGRIMEWERKYNELLREYKALERTVEKLQNSNAKLEDNLYDCEWRIKKELEPRIKREERNYDLFVTSPEREV